ncbi:hypothetical protein DEU56DRAFT_335747 [Suillus clintonianus]|uniref:uncharacterized protein n=1 Tax=Suillus clintonianus TaxID=1904413 RepID=UPI001B873A12|nr:uncharacterized protein DEU56DRAFT_335747 [Suillus clintonianus]KAG2138484.1 hypothetical protein DEU56DRAFT_335747 [Suillus clintonianus]
MNFLRACVMLRLSADTWQAAAASHPLLLVSFAPRDLFSESKLESGSSRQFLGKKHWVAGRSNPHCQGRGGESESGVLYITLSSTGSV